MRLFNSAIYGGQMLYYELEPWMVDTEHFIPSWWLAL